MGVKEMGYWKEWKQDCQRAIYELLLSFSLYWNDDIEVNTLEEEWLEEEMTKSISVKERKTKITPEKAIEDTLTELGLEELWEDNIIVNTLDRRNT